MTASPLWPVSIRRKPRGRVDLTLLRRDAHEMLDSTARRHKEAWRTLDHLHNEALKLVHCEIPTIYGARRISLDRSDSAQELVSAATDAAAVLVTGDSGVGKSALTLLSLAAA